MVTGKPYVKMQHNGFNFSRTIPPDRRRARTPSCEQTSSSPHSVPSLPAEVSPPSLGRSVDPPGAGGKKGQLG